MRSSLETTVETRERIIAVAAHLFRESGIQRTSVVDFMNASGLTHGGFYKHFESKETLVAAACELALATTHAQLAKKCEAAKDEQALAALVTAYLTIAHCEHPGEGCAIATLGPEAVQQDGLAKATVSDGAENLLSLIRKQLLRSGKKNIDSTAHAILASIVGGLILARTMKDRNKSVAVLRDTRKFILEAI